MAVVIGGKTYYFMLDVCREARISRSTLLRWLKRGVIREPIKDRRGWRIFSEENLETIRKEVEKTLGNHD